VKKRNLPIQILDIRRYEIFLVGLKAALVSPALFMALFMHMSSFSLSTSDELETGETN
jgi:hypothetical protein